MAQVSGVSSSKTRLIGFNSLILKLGQERMAEDDKMLKVMLNSLDDGAFNVSEVRLVIAGCQLPISKSTVRVIPDIA
jgi:DNA integrity scanning protein DisA with diadenylate cyclase activity